MTEREQLETGNSIKVGRRLIGEDVILLLLIGQKMPSLPLWGRVVNTKLRHHLETL